MVSLPWLEQMCVAPHVKMLVAGKFTWRFHLEGSNQCGTLLSGVDQSLISTRKRGTQFVYHHSRFRDNLHISPRSSYSCCANAFAHMCDYQLIKMRQWLWGCLCFISLELCVMCANDPQFWWFAVTQGHDTSLNRCVFPETLICGYLSWEATKALWEG